MPRARFLLTRRPPANLPHDRQVSRPAVRGRWDRQVDAGTQQLAVDVGALHRPAVEPGAHPLVAVGKRVGGRYVWRHP